LTSWQQVSKNNHNAQAREQWVLRAHKELLYLIATRSSLENSDKPLEVKNGRFYLQSFWEEKNAICG
jgi:hypothetical protein